MYSQMQHAYEEHQSKKISKHKIINKLVFLGDATLKPKKILNMKYIFQDQIFTREHTLYS